MSGAMVLVRWRDSCVLHDQVDSADLPTPSELETVGWLSKQTSEYIVVSRDHSPGRGSFSWRSNLAIPKTDVREMIVLSAEGVLSGRPVESPVPLAPPLVPTIVATVADRYAVTPTMILGDGRAQPATTARQAAMRLVREMTDLSLPEIGRIFNRDHSTVLHACKVTEGMALGDIREEIMVKCGEQKPS